VRSLLIVLAVGWLARDAAAEPPSGIAVGVEVGEPTAATVRWAGLDGFLGVNAAIGSGTRSGAGLALHADLTVTPVVAYRRGGTQVPLHVGVGVRRYAHGYQPMSIDEVPDVHTGVRLVLGAGLALADPSLELYLELAPGYDLSRSDSCTLVSGTDSLCPHAQSGRGFVDLVLGARWYL
jgi:hypothetical protein